MVQVLEHCKKVLVRVHCKMAGGQGHCKTELAGCRMGLVQGHCSLVLVARKLAQGHCRLEREDYMLAQEHCKKEKMLVGYKLVREHYMLELALALVDYKLALGHYKRGLEDYRMGLEDYRTGLEDCRRAEAHCRLGLVLKELGHCSLVQDCSQARECYRKVQVHCRQERELDYKMVELQVDYKRLEGLVYK